METLVVVAQHRGQYFKGGKSGISDQFGSTPSRSFEGINCRTFQSGVGILPSPSSVLPSHRTTTTPKNSTFYSEPSKQSRRSNPIAIHHKSTTKVLNFNDEVVYSELWAGPTYSNSPPPSSLPIPKFSLRQNRSVSLDLPASVTGFKIQPLARSAPPSPTREPSSSATDFFFSNAYATQGLRRMLNLDSADA